MDINTHLAKRIRALRKSRGYALEYLAELSGVSRSMISLIEREETSPTATVLNKLAGALGVPLSTLFSDAVSEACDQPIARTADQQAWQDPVTGYLRRHLSPPDFASPLELAEITFPAHESLSFEPGVRHSNVHQQVWILEGEMNICVGEVNWVLQQGDCLAMSLDQPIIFRNPSSAPARYLVASTNQPPSSRRA